MYMFINFTIYCLCIFDSIREGRTGSQTRARGAEAGPILQSNNNIIIIIIIIIYIYIYMYLCIYLFRYIYIYIYINVSIDNSII